MSGVADSTSGVLPLLPSNRGQASTPTKPIANAVFSAWRRLVRVVRPAVILTISTSLLFHAFVALQGIMLARILGPVARGEYGTAVFFAKILSFIGLVGTHLAIARHGARSPDRTRELSGAATRTGFVVGMCAMVLAVVLAATTVPSTKQYLLPLCILASLQVPFAHLQLSLLAVDHGSGQFTRYNSIRLFSAAVFPLMLAVAWSVGAVSLNSIVLLFILQPLMTLCVLLVSRREWPLAGPYHPPCRQLLYEGLPYATAMLVGTLLMRMDVYLVLLLADLEMQGLYVAALPIAHLMAIVPNAVGLFAFRRGAQSDRGLRRKHLLSVIPVCVGIQLISGAVLMLAVPVLVRVLYGEAFRLTATFAVALIPAYAVAGLAGIADSYLRGQQKTMIGVWSRLVAAGVMGLVVIALYGRMQIYSLPWGVLASHVTNLVILFTALIACREAAAGGVPEDETT